MTTKLNDFKHIAAMNISAKSVTDTIYMAF